MDKKKIYRSIVLLIAGIALFWFVFKDTNISEVLNEMQKFKWQWIGISILANVLSQFVRALRWKTLYKPLKYTPKTYNLFFATLMLGFTNQLIPRGGEIARLGVVNQYEKIPMPKLLGIALVERLTDFILLILIFGIIIIWQFPLIQQLLAIPEINPQNFNSSTVFIALGIILFLIIAIYLVNRKFKLTAKYKTKIAQAKNDIKQGFNSFIKIQNKPIYIIQSVLIYALWLFMLYVLFLAYSPTKDLGFKEAAFTFGLATMAFLLPVQAGMGAWHFVVIQCLLILGIDPEQGKAFALVAHATTNLVYLPLGLITLLLLPLYNKKTNNAVNKIL